MTGASWLMESNHEDLKEPWLDFLAWQIGGWL